MFDTIIDMFKYKPIIIADIGVLILIAVSCVTITTLLVLIWIYGIPVGGLYGIPIGGIYGIPVGDDDSDKETYPIGNLGKIIIVFIIIAIWLLAYAGGYAMIQNIQYNLQLTI